MKTVSPPFTPFTDGDNNCKDNTINDKFSILVKVYNVGCIAVVEVAVLGSKQRKVSEITEMDLIAAAVQRTAVTFAYV